MRIKTSLLGGAIVGGLLASSLSSHGQAADALLDKLVQKGVLTLDEANELRDQSDKDLHKAYQTKTGMADWVTSMQFNGDFRGRFERNASDDVAYHTRDRLRYRVRFGITTVMLDNFEVGLRLASGNAQFNPGGTLVGGAPITANQDLGSLETRKFLWIDAAFARWTAVRNGDWLVTGTFGKMDNPFQLSNMVFDHDINPEGMASQVAYTFNDQHTLRATGGYFMLDEINQSASGVGAGVIDPERDPAFAGGQLMLESKWSGKFETAVGASVFGVDARKSLSAKTQPLYNTGNSRNADGVLLHNYNPIIGSASATYKLDSFPLYAGAFPIKVSGEYLNNPGASADNQGYRVGLTFGKAGHKRTWEIGYRYQRLEADAWFDAMVDDDNGGFYGKGNPQLTGTGKVNGWFGGTNVKGHLVQATYSFTDFLNLSVTYYLNDLIRDVPTAAALPGQSSDASHFMVDLMWKF